VKFYELSENIFFIGGIYHTLLNYIMELNVSPQKLYITLIFIKTFVPLQREIQFLFPINSCCKSNKKIRILALEVIFITYCINFDRKASSIGNFLKLLLTLSC
jgi:hypothetical protein